MEISPAPKSVGCSNACGPKPNQSIVKRHWQLVQAPLAARTSCWKYTRRRVRPGIACSELQLRHWRPFWAMGGQTTRGLEFRLCAPLAEEFRRHWQPPCDFIQPDTPSTPPPLRSTLHCLVDEKRTVHTHRTDLHCRCAWKTAPQAANNHASQCTTRMRNGPCMRWPSHVNQNRNP